MHDTPFAVNARVARHYRRQLRRGRCVQCGQERRLPGDSRGPRCRLQVRRYMRDRRGHGAWQVHRGRPGPGRQPRWTDAQLTRLIGRYRC